MDIDGNKVEGTTSSECTSSKIYKMKSRLVSHIYTHTTNTGSIIEQRCIKSFYEEYNKESVKITTSDPYCHTLVNTFFLNI